MAAAQFGDRLVAMVRLPAALCTALPLSVNEGCCRYQFLRYDAYPTAPFGMGSVWVQNTPQAYFEPIHCLNRLWQLLDAINASMVPQNDPLDSYFSIFFGLVSPDKTTYTSIIGSVLPFGW